MDGSGKIAFHWGDGEEHAFRLGMAELRELQDITGIGPMALFTRIRSGDWKIDDLRQPIRLGLKGAGAEPGAAARLMRDYVDARPLAESAAPALIILAAALFGPEKDDAEKKAPAETGAVPPPASTSLN